MTIQIITSPTDAGRIDRDQQTRFKSVNRGASFGSVIGTVAPVDERRQAMDQMGDMQLQGHLQNLEMLELQESAQSESRRFTALSDLMKAQHDTAKAAISNIRV
jgi:hypothetical protein